MSGIFRNINPQPPHCPASVYPPPPLPLVRGEDTLAGWRGGGGTIVRKTPDTRVGNFRQKNNSAEDGIDGTNGYFRRNSGCSAEQKFSEFRSEPFRGRENISELRSVEQK
jgi:hypothetical protein